MSNGWIATRRPRARRRRAQGGVVLFVALTLLVGVTLITLTSAGMSGMELRMAGSVEGNAQTFQRTLAAIDFVLSDPANFPVGGPLNEPAAVTLTGASFTAGTSASAARVEDCASPPRMTSATSMTAYSAFLYQVRADVEETGELTGMSQGYLQLGPKC